MSLTEKVNNRRLIDGQDDVVQLYPIKYKWAWQYYNAANANHWLPQEINMQKDVEQWRASNVLTENERNVIKTALGFFTTADSLVANNLVLGVYGSVTSPECRMYLLRQAYEEAIHTHSYQHIVETLGLDEEEVFEKYKTVEAIYNKDNFVTKLAQGMYWQNHVDNQEFLESLIDFYIIMEGIFFYSSFAAIMSFKRRNLLPGTVEQFQYIMRDESMHMNFGIDLINGIKQENPELWSVGFQDKITNKILEAMSLEIDYAQTLIGNGILGLTSEAFAKYTAYISARRAEAIGLTIQTTTKNPFPWMSEIIDLPKQKNFFETRVTDYQQGGLQWS